MRPGAVILCGGRSRRMGRAKEWLPFGPEPMLRRVARLVSESAGPVVVAAASEQDLPELPFGVMVVRDPAPDRGPLQGLAEGLLALPPGVEVAYVTAVDAPLLVPAWIERLAGQIGPRDAVIPSCEGILQPLAALYRRDAALVAVASLLAMGRLRLRDLAEEIDALILDAEEFRDIDPQLGSLRNLNEPEDYRRACATAGFDPVEP